MSTYDTVVIGGGVAGVGAALAAAAAGARVALVRAGPGASALAAGGWVGTPPAGLTEALAVAGLTLVECSAPLPHPDGRLLACDVAPSSHAAAGLNGGTAEHVLVCGIAGLPGWRPAALAALWADAAGLLPGSLEAATVTLPDTPAAGWSEASLAAHLEREAGRLGTEVAHRVRERGAARVILPAVLGVDAHARVRETVESAAGVRVGEALGRAPSVPGWRLDRALLRCLEAAGVAIITGRVTGHGTWSGGAGGGIGQAGVSEVTILGDEGQITIAGGGFVLATGRFIGGGITAGDTFTESAFGFDVGLERFGETFRDPGAALSLTDPVRTEPQPVLGIGVGVIPYENVVVAGSVRAGMETAGLGLGHAAADGWAAGERAGRQPWA